MRKEGAKSYFKEARDAELSALFRKMLCETEMNSLNELFAAVVKQPSSRFWVSEDRAAIVVRDVIHRGYDLRQMKLQTARMYAEILKRVLKIREKNPERDIYSIVFEVVNSPAPEFYLTSDSAKVLIYAWRRRQKALRKLKQYYDR